jgi:hypothetical protein
MLVLILGIVSGIDPLLCTIRGLIGGMVGWIGGALWAYVMSQLMPPETSIATPALDSPKPEPDEEPAESEESAESEEAA